MSTIGCEQFKIKTYDADVSNKLKIGSIFNFMQEAAANNADSLKFGYKDLINKDQGWVLSRALLHIYGSAGYGDIITVETWAKGIDKIFALRDFIIRNNDNKIIAKATTSWLLININSKRPQRLDDLKDHFTAAKEPAIAVLPDKIIEPENKVFINERTAVYSDIDIYRHVNNVKFLEYSFDALDSIDFNALTITKLQINFLSEFKLGEKLKLFKNDADGKKCYIDGNKDNIKIFQMYFEYE